MTGRGVALAIEPVRPAPSERRRVALRQSPVAHGCAQASRRHTEVLGVGARQELLYAERGGWKGIRGGDDGKTNPPGSSADGSASRVTATNPASGKGLSEQQKQSIHSVSGCSCRPPSGARAAGASADSSSLTAHSETPGWSSPSPQHTPASATSATASSSNNAASPRSREAGVASPVSLGARICRRTDTLPRDRRSVKLLLQGVFAHRASVHFGPTSSTREGRPLVCYRPTATVANGRF